MQRKLTLDESSKRLKVLQKALKKAERGGFSRIISSSEASSLIFAHDFAKVVFGKESLYLVDMSPDWAHDEGDKEFEWLTEKEFRKYAEAFHTQFNSIFKKCKSDFEIVQDDYKICIMERPAWEVRLQEMVLESDPLSYLEKFL